MARVLVSINNFCRRANDYEAMPPFYQSFIEGLRDAGNEVVCYQTRAAAGGNRFPSEIPEEAVDFLRRFDPELCIFFNNNFWDVSEIVQCPIVIYDVDSPLEWQLQDSIKSKPERYLYVYNQSKGRESIQETFQVDDARCCYIPFFTEIRADDQCETTNNIVFLGTNWSWHGYNFLNNFMRTNPSGSDVRKALEVLDAYTQEPLMTSEELYHELKNRPHDRINFGNLWRCSLEVSGLRRIHYLQAVADLGLEIVGRYWTIDMMNYFPEVLACVRDRSVWTKEENQAYYNSAKLALGTNHIQAKAGFSFRVCDILASNACLVTERSEDLIHHFPHVHIPMFTSPAEERELCLKLLKNENMRKDIVSAAHEAIDGGFRFKNVRERLEDFTGLVLHTEETGTLRIFPDTKEEENEMNRILGIAPPDRKKGIKLNCVQKAYYNTLGKHLGYDPYGHFRKKYIYIGKHRVFKMLYINKTRKELYFGCLPLVAYTQKKRRSKLSLLLFEKLGRGIKKARAYLRKGKRKEVAPEVFEKDMRLKAMREKIRNGEKIKVCLFVSRINCWMFEDIYRLMKESGHFDPVIVVKPFMSRGLDHMKECMTSTYDALVEMGYEPIKGYDEQTDTYLDVKNDIDPDIVFYTKFWKPHFQQNFYISTFRDRMTCLIDYGYSLTVHNDALNSELQNQVDIYFYYSPLQKEIVSKIMKNHGENVVISGSPKLDKVFDPTYVPNDVWKPQERPKKRIIWAPHHEDRTDRTMYQLDAFYDLYEIMPAIAEKYKDDVQFAFKPHPLLKHKLLDKWGEAATEEYYEMWRDMSNGQLEEGPFIDLFLSSDAMILDCLSFVAEYTATNKPALFTVGSKSRVILNEMGEALYQQLYHAEDDLENEICAFIEQVVLQGDDPMREKRTQFIEENMLPPNGRTASENVCASILEFVMKEEEQA